MQKPAFWKNIAALALLIFFASFYFHSQTEKPGWLKWINEKSTPPDSLATIVAASSPETDTYLMADYNACIDCLNRHSGRATDSYLRYLSWVVDVEKGPTGREKHIYGLYPLYDPAPCLEATQDVFPYQPKVSAQVDAYRNALQTVYEISETLYAYYDHEDYKDDTFSTGKAQHLPLLQAFEAYREASVALSGQMDSLRKAHWEAQGPDPSYRIMATAAQLLDSCRGKAVLSLEVAMLEPLIQRIETDLATWKKQSDENASDPFLAMYPVFTRSANEFLKEAKSLMRRARDQEAFDRSERMLLDELHSDTVKGSFPALAAAYKHLVHIYNLTQRTIGRWAVPQIHHVPELPQQLPANAR